MQPLTITRYRPTVSRNARSLPQQIELAPTGNSERALDRLTQTLDRATALVADGSLQTKSAIRSLAEGLERAEAGLANGELGTAWCELGMTLCQFATVLDNKRKLALELLDQFKTIDVYRLKHEQRHMRGLLQTATLLGRHIAAINAIKAELGGYDEAILDFGEFLS